MSERYVNSRILWVLNPFLHRFADLETVIATRISVLDYLGEGEAMQQFGDIQTELSQTIANLKRRSLITLSKAARDSSQSQAALNSISKARLTSGASHPLDLQLEYGAVLWMQGEHNLAIDSLRRIAQSADRAGLEMSHVLHASILSQLVCVVRSY